MTLHQIRYFLSVCRTGSISKTAQEYYVSVQSVSKTISAMETELGTTLFSRSSFGLVPTADGKIVQKQLEKAYHEIEALPALLNARRSGKIGSFRLCFAFGVMKGIGASILDKFKQLYPDIEILLEDHIDSECEKLLLQDRVDVIVSIGRLTENNLLSCMLCSEQSYCIIHKDHPLYKKPFTVRDLLEYKILYMPSDFRGALPLEELEQKYGIHVKETFVSSQFDLLKNMAERNQGIFIIPECGMYPISPDVEYVPFPDSSYTWDVYATIKADNTNPSAKLFYDFCCGL